MVDLSKESIGATRITAVAGINPYTAPIDVWSEIFGISAGFSGNEASRLGLQLEPTVAKDYAMKNNLAFNVDDYVYDGLGNNSYVGSKELLSPTGQLALQPGDKVWHPDIPYFHCTPDFLIPNADGEITKILEIKTFGLLSGGRGASEVWGKEYTDEVPSWYFAQVQWQMYIIGPQIQEVDLHVMVPGFGDKLFYTYTIKRDDELIEILAQKGHEFWNENVLKEVAPPTDGSDSYKNYLADRFPKNNTTVINDDGTSYALVQEYKEGKKMMDIGKNIMQEAQNMLKNIIGENTGIKGDWGLVSWKNIKDGQKVDFESAFNHLSQMCDDTNGRQTTKSILENNTVIKKGYRRFSISSRGK